MWPVWLASAFAQESELAPQLRRPAALAVHGERMYVANRRSGSVSVVDLAKRHVVAEYAVGQQLEDIAVVNEGKTLLAVDSGANQLVRIEIREGHVSVVERLPIPGAPVSVRAAADGSFCSVASLWARRVSLIDLAPPAVEGAHPISMRLRAAIDLPFAPRLQWLSRDGSRWVVADSFGGRLAVIDPAAGRLLAVRSFDGHNLRGMAADSEKRELLVSHQILNEAVPTTRDRVFWGTVMGNVVRSIPLNDLLTPRAETSLDRSSRVYDLAHWSLHPLGRPGAAAGDPGAIAVTREGKAVVALSGVNEIAFRTAPRQPFFQRAVGRRPVAIALDEQERFAYIANMFDDSISVLDFEQREIVNAISLGPQPQASAADRGETMFYDARFALDGWYSCHSCHTDGHTNGLRNDNFSDDTAGAPKRVLSLLGVADTGPWAWSGAQASLQEQIHKSITVTMRDHEAMHATEQNVADLAAYLQTHSPPPSLLEARGEVDPAAKERGRQVFHAQGCADCHQPATYTTARVYDVGLTDETGRREFNPPSLLGVSQRDALFHDNRAASLEDVLVKFQHADAHALSPEDRDALIAFLRSL